jgi:hypothetical protein
LNTLSKGGFSILQLPKQTPLPATIVPGMQVVPLEDATLGTVRGITQAYCVYQLAGSGRLCVAAWSQLALANVSPTHQLLPADVTENDRQNASAMVLRELLLLEPFGLSAAQAAAKEELLHQLCSV